MGDKYVLPEGWGEQTEFDSSPWEQNDNTNDTIDMPQKPSQKEEIPKHQPLALKQCIESQDNDEDMTSVQDTINDAASSDSKMEVRLSENMTQDENSLVLFLEDETYVEEIKAANTSPKKMINKIHDTIMILVPIITVICIIIFLLLKQI